MSNPTTWQQHYSSIVARFPGLARHNDQLQAFGASIVAAIEDGTVMGGDTAPTLDEFLRRYWVEKAAAFAGRNRGKFLVDLVDGGMQEAFGFGADWDVPILVCDEATLHGYFGQVFPQKHTVNRSDLNADDLRLMAMHTHRKRLNMDDLDDKVQPRLQKIADLARGYGTVAEAWRAGAFASVAPV